ncbi:MAG: NUDIX domain-containing protein [Candidatus Berkiellales bacterium]
MSKPTWTPSLQLDDVEINKADYVHQGFYQVKRLKLRHRCFSGEWSPWLTREQIRRADAAAILLFDPKQDKLVLIEQFRVGMVGVYADQSPWLLEIVAGLLEINERPEEAIIRESKEEAGCTPTQVIKIGEFYNTPGGFAEKTYMYLGIVDATDVGGVHGVGTEHEDILVHVLPTEAVFAALDNGSLVTSASTVMALQWLKMNRNKVPSQFTQNA